MRLLLILGILIANTVSAQKAGKYWFFLKNDFNRNTTHLSLSTKAIQKREALNIAFDQNDFAIASSYVEQVNNLGGKVVFKSRWLNALSVIIDSKEDYNKIVALPFVKDVQLVKKYTQFRDPVIQKKVNYNRASYDSAYYGSGFNQIKMLNGIDLHQKGYLGQGVTIAVFDNGYRGVDTIMAFDSLRAEGRIKAVYDFVHNNDQVYDEGDHGTMVLSTMASLTPDSLVGTAPKADYYLFVTEDNSQENTVEEDNWVRAIEYADSLGTDVTNTSLGYTEFQDPGTSYTYNDMDGNTTIITRAADMAAKKGMLVVNSAGNSGNDAWYYIGAPADGDSVLAIGAVNADGGIVGFSSRGPSSDGRVKPNVCAQGAYSAVALPNNSFSTSFGTSFSGPIIAGMSACLWQAHPNKSNMTIFNAIQQSSHLFETPNDDYGYGIPNYKLADSLLTEDTTFVSFDKFYSTLSPNPFIDELTLYLVSEIGEEVEVNVININGQIVASKSANLQPGRNAVSLNEFHAIVPGLYFVSVPLNGEKRSLKMLKL